MNDEALSPLRILFVVNSPDEAQLLLLQLEQEGLRVDSQRVDTEEAFTAALDSRPHLILSDFALPHFNGLRALHILQQRGLDIPFILISGTVGEEVAVDAIKQGADDYLLKDHLARLGSAIQQALEQKRLREEKKRADDVLRTSEQHFRSLIDHSYDAIALGNAEGLITYMSPPTSQIIGYAPEELIGTHGLALVHPDELEYLQSQLAEIIQNPEHTVILQFRIRHQDGSWRWVEAVVRNLLDNPNVGALVGNYRDITRRKQVDQNLLNAEARYRTLVEQIPPIVYMAGLGQHLGVTYISPQIKILGFTQDEWVADPELWFRQIHPDDQQKVLADIEQSENNGKPFESEYRILTRDGDVKWFMDEAMDVLDRDGRVLFRQGFMLDITARKNAEASLISRERYLELLNDMTQTVLLSRDMTSTLQALAMDMAKLIDADDCYITRWDDEKQLTIPTVTTANLASPYANPEGLVNEINMTASVMEHDHVLAADDVLNSPFISPQMARQYPARSVLGVPLIAGEHKLGAAILAFNNPHHFTEEEIERAEQAGRQVALALHYFQQGLEVQQRLKESNALALIGRALSATEHTGTGKVLQLIVNSALDLITHAEESVIHLLDPNEQVLIAQAVSGFSDQGVPFQRVHMKLGEGVAGQVINEGITINIGDIENDPRFIRAASLPSFRSLLVAPVQSGRQQIGTISVQSDKRFAFSAQDVELLNALGIQAAIAIENTRLFETTQQQLKEVDALYKISQGLVASLDADQLIKDVVILLHENFGYYHVQIYTVDRVSGDLILKSGSGRVGDQLLEEGFKLSRGTGIVGHVAETAEPFVTNNVNAMVFFARNPLLPHTHSELTVPIVVDGEVVGVLDIQDAPPNRFSHDELRLMTAVADQLAVALQKANLYKDLQNALQDEQAVRSQLIQNERLALVGRLLASVSHELNNPLQAIQNALFLLKDETKLSAQASQDLNIILSETERMAALIERLRSTYRPNRIQDFQPVELNNLIEDVHALIATHMRHKDIVFEFVPDLDLPIILGLPDQLRQVMLNLFLNAMEVMKPGGCVTILTRWLPEQNEVFLSVKDTGPGIDPEILPRIFEPFITSKYTGTGLGLTITHDIIQQHHGRIEAQNDPQGGAIINIWLPTNEKGGS